MNTLLKNAKRIALQLDNSSQWLALDKTLTELNKVIVSVPHFFSIKQITHMATSASIDLVICEWRAEPLWQSLGYKHVLKNDSCLFMQKNTKNYSLLPKGTHKITFTSGTTNEPKGVCLSLPHLQAVGQSLGAVSNQFKVKKHLCILPLSVLLENVAANYATFGLDIEVITPALSELGLSGSSQLDINKLMATIIKYKPDSFIVMPQILKAIVVYCEKNQVDLSFLKFIAVGGAVCSKGLLSKAHDLKLPVYEGYGISECGSVISLNTNTNDVGSVGKVLPHQQVKIAEDGEILAKGQLFCGYLGQQTYAEKWFATGDFGRLDKNKNLTIIGRKTNIIINSFGRNISPDWLEAELLSLSTIDQVAIYGESKPYLVAIVVSNTGQRQIMNEIERLNESFPDYAQVKHSILSSSPFTVENNTLTASGKTKHQEIFKNFKPQLEKLYAQA